MIRGVIVFLLSLFLMSVGRAPAEESFPQRIVSLNPVVTEELFLLGAGARVVGRSRYCTRPTEALEKEEVGTVVEVSIEKIAALRPDLVVLGTLVDSRTKEKLKQLGIRVEEFPAAEDFQGICESFLRLGRMIGKVKESEEMTERAKAQVARVRPQLAGPDEIKPSVFIQVGSDPLVTMSKNSFFNDLIEFAGGTNIARDAGPQVYSREKVLASDPDVIIIVGMGYDGEKEQQLWQGYGDLSAARTGRIHLVDSDLFCAPTPLSFADALERMIQLIHPEEVVK